ncbi:hypothetical protein KMZ68_19095 [Bradyrhizobium sediminis]|uniref:Glycosyl transferase n=1 Tax=Bradyrhizobium sediminis TaxID=2840469 RepID=A0A975NN80_9BRAD|nr:hypothetical protein [Bradyrhizobium sediminis]QWG17074.1 hypothetical protein KMZ68_19095 [Bradyrhizobium sediminis]
MSERVYCTYFDHNYLSRGLALYGSLQRHAPGARLWVLCLSEACHRILTALDLPGIVPVRLADFEAAEPEVAATRSTRSLIEYYFTCSPAWMLFVLGKEPDAEWVSYLDSDLFFFAPPDPIFAEMEDSAFGIIPHRFTSRLAHMRRFGIYNVGWVSVRRRDEGFAALRWWRERCIEWCYDRVEGDRFADQRYLDRLPELFGGIHVIEHLGANLAPWNIANYRLEWRDGSVKIEGRYPLLFFHFYGVKLAGRYYYNSHRVYHAPFSSLVRHRIYEPYVAALAEADLTVAAHRDDQEIKAIRKPSVRSYRDRLPNALRKVRAATIRGLDIVTGRAIASPDNQGR